MASDSTTATTRPRRGVRRSARTRRSFRLVAETLESRHLLATIQWIGGAAGSWNDSANWDAARLPNSNDDVIIPDASEVTIAATGLNARTVTGGQLAVKPGGALQLYAGGSVRGLDVEGGSIHFGHVDTMTITDRLEWSGGSIVSSIPVTLAGTGTIDGAEDKFLGARFHFTDTIDIGGTGTLFVNGGNTGFDIPADAVLTLTGTAQIRASDNAWGSRIYVAGTLRKSGAGESVIDTRGMTQLTIVGGTIDVQAGTMHLVRPSANFEGGTFLAAEGATLRMSDVWNNWTGRFEGGGGGRVEFASGNFWTIGTGAEFAFPKGLFHWTGGVFNASASQPLRNTGWIQISGAGASVLGPNALVNEGGVHLGEGTFWSARGVTNTATGVLELEDGAAIDDGNITNYGRIMKVGGSGAATFRQYNQITNLGGTIGATAGKLVLDNILRITDAVFDVAPGATVESTRDFGFGGTLTGSGGGQVEIRGGSFWTQATNSVNFPEGMFRIFSSYVAGDAAPIRNDGFLELTGENTGLTFRAVFENAGTVVQSFTGSSTIYGFAVIRNLAGALWEMRDTGFVQYVDFFNAGTIRGNAAGKTASFGSRLTNQPGGTIEVLAGTLAMNAGGDYEPMTMRVVAGAELQFAGPQIHYFRTGTFSSTGTGTVRAISTALFSVGDAFPVFDFAEGVLLLDDGTQLWDGITFAGYAQIVADTFVFMRSSDARPIRNTGVFRHSGSGNFLINVIGSFHNQGIYELTSDADFQISGVPIGGIPVGFINTGLFRKSGGSGTSALIDPDSLAVARFDNQGTVEVTSGTLSLGERVQQLTREGSGINARNVLTGGIWKVGSSGVLEMPGGTNFAPGATLPPIAVNRADVTITGPAAQFPQFTALARNEGRFALAGGRDFVTAGPLANTGEMTLGPESRLEVTGVLESSGTLRFLIGGSPASGRFGTIETVSQAVLAGAAAVALADGYGPVEGLTYELIRFGSRNGEFATFDGLGDRFASSFLPGSFVVIAGAGFLPADLSPRAESISLTGQMSPGGTVSIAYTVDNAGAQAFGDWTDSVYLSLDTILDPSDFLVARHLHTGGAGTHYDASFSATIPAIPAGSYFVLVQADSRKIVSDLDRSNNVAASLGRVSVDVERLEYDQTKQATLRDGQDLYFRLDVTAGADVRIDATFASTFQGEFYVRQGHLPTRFAFDFTASNLTELARSIRLASPQGGAYYVLIHGLEGAGSGASVTLQATRTTFAVAEVSQSNFANAGPATFEIRGTGFEPGSVVELLSPDGTRLKTATVEFVDANTLYATVDFAGVAAGNYRLRVSTQSSAGELAGGVAVVAASTARVEVFVSSPGNIRAGRIYTLRLTWRNSGDVAATAPLIRLSASDAQLRMPGDAHFGGKELLFLGTSPTGPAGVLAPGEEMSVEVEFLPEGSTSFSAFVAESGAAVDWNAIKPMLKPVFVDDSLWNEIWPAFVARAGGDDAAAIGRTLAENATRLGMLGHRTVRIDRLLAFEMSELNLATLALRNTRGTFGVGPTDFFDARAFEDDRQVAFLLPDAGRIALFVKSGTQIVPASGEFGTASRTAGKLLYRTEQGETYAFRADGRLESFSKRNGQKFMARYDAQGRLAAIEQGSDVLMSFTRDALGRVVGTTDLSGSVTTFGYEGDSLDYATRTGSGGTSMVRRNPAGGLSGNAIVEIADPSGVAIRFEYDEIGRVVRQGYADGSQAATITHDATGGRLYEQSGGTVVRLLANQFGNLGQMIDPVGAPVTTRFDSAGRMAEARLPDGSRYRYEYDAQGRMTAVSDPNGAVTRFSYTESGRLRTYTAPDGAVTLYEYDAAGQLQRVVRADGTSQSFAYSPNGLMTTYVNRRGQSVTYEYDARDLLVRRSVAGGEVTQYVYDDRGNAVRTVRTLDGSSTEMLYDYDTQNLLTGIRYPDGRTIRFEYDASGRRTSVEESDGVTTFVTRYRYTASGRLEAILDGAGTALVTYEYDSSGLPIRQTNGDGSFTAWTRNAAGMVTGIAHGDAGGVAEAIVYEYDALGQLISASDSTGTTTYRYDAVGQLAGLTLPGGRTIEYFYDSRGNRTSVIDDGAVTTYVADAMNRYLSAGATTYGYDADGNLVTRTTAAGTMHYVYDALGRLIEANGQGGDVRFEYDAFGYLAAITENGVRTALSVDIGGLVPQVLARYDASGAVIDRFAFGEQLALRADGTGTRFFARDLGGNVVGVTDGLGNLADRWSYLPFGELREGTPAAGMPFGFSGGAGSLTIPGGLVHMNARVYDPALGRFLSEDPRGINGGDGNFYRYVRNAPLTMNDPTGMTGFPIEMFMTAAANVAIEIQAVEVGVVATMAEYQAIAQGAAQRLLFLSQASAEFSFSQLTPAQQRLVKVVYEGTQHLARMRPAPAAGGATGAAAGGSVFSAALIPGLLIGIPFGFFLDSQIEKNPQLEVYIVNDGLVDFLSWSFFGGSSSNQVAASDPNAIVGPAGVGESGYTQGQGRFDYTVFFENKPEATAPAQEVVITQRLDDDLDIATFELGGFGFSGLRFEVPGGLRQYAVRLDLRDTLGLFVDFEAGIDMTTREIRYVFRSIDPVTLDLTPDALAGFLPPNRTSPEGEGYVSYSARPAGPLESGIRITEQARIVFDTEAPIDTNVWTNTIDLTPPVSSVEPLPQFSESPFVVRWGGSDPSGIVAYDVFVSTDGGPFVALVTGTTATSIQFEGVAGRTYAFYSVATDGVFLREDDPAAAQAITTVRQRTGGVTVIVDGLPVVDGVPVSLGVTPAGKPGPIRTFEIRNDGSEPLTLGEPRLPAGVILIEKPSVIGPGQSGLLKVAILSDAAEIAGSIEIEPGDIISDEHDDLNGVKIEIKVSGRSVDGAFLSAREAVIPNPRPVYVGGQGGNVVTGSPSDIVARVTVENRGNARWRGLVGFRAILEPVDGSGPPIVVETSAMARRVALRPGASAALRLRFRLPAPVVDGAYRVTIEPTGSGVADGAVVGSTAATRICLERPRTESAFAIRRIAIIQATGMSQVITEVRNVGNVRLTGVRTVDLVAVPSSGAPEAFVLAGGLRQLTNLAPGASRRSKLRFVVPAELPEWVETGDYRLELRPTE